ncbi:ChaB family protein [Spiractinospora alimapuensis]|uniref:ChaB family protein n=1 Tax=Spiractinospora alimapuensis TaxID=2820884 RepID=UPI001F37299D|nr:ChaB family protein [Spiractinospora alimapuensis]QVQ52332.1 ChaB family protein [Spiractinospora alimapuensis]
MPGRQELPDTVRRSPAKAQRTWIKAHDSAVDSYGEGQRAHRVAYAALKHGFEKVGDHWEAKKRSGPSERRAVSRRAPGQRGTRRPSGGVDENASKSHLYQQARRLGIRGRSTMSKDALIDALRRASDTRTSKAKGR